MNRKQAEEHFRRDIWYPITAEGIKELFDNMIHFTTEERNWVNEHVPPGVYANPEDAISAVEWEPALSQRSLALRNTRPAPGQLNPPADL